MDRQLIQYTIFVGLADRKTGFQKYSTEKYLSILKNHQVIAVNALHICCFVV